MNRFPFVFTQDFYINFFVKNKTTTFRLRIYKFYKDNAKLPKSSQIIRDKYIKNNAIFFASIFPCIKEIPTDRKFRIDVFQ